MLSNFINQFTPELSNTAISAIIIFIIAFLIYIVFGRKVNGEKQKHRLRSRIIYISVLILILILIRVWIEGFSNLFTMLSLVAAGLVITNKENIMNISGWLIINWRGLFAEGDYIQVQNLIGYVEAIKPLHFKLYETTGLGCNEATGKTIKIPNGLIITSPITVFSDSTNFMRKSIPYVVSMDKNTIAIAQTARKTISALLDKKYKDNPAFCKKTMAKKNKSLASMIEFEPVVEIKTFPDKEKLVLIQTSFYCHISDAMQLEQDFLALLIKKYGKLQA